MGAVRGLVIVWLFQLRGGFMAFEIVGQIALAGVYVPIGLAALRILERHEQAIRYVLLTLLGAAVLLVEPALAQVLGVLGKNAPPYGTRVIGSLDTNLLFYLTVVVAAAAVDAAAKHVNAEVKTAHLEAAVADAQLHVLTLQLHPHFLFNALNLVSQLAYESVDAARRAIANLRSLLAESLRYSVHREVSLAEELEFLRAYLEIQEARFRGRLFSTTRIEPGLERAAVPHLLLQPLVENAIVHGLAHRDEKGRIEVAARRDGGRMVLTVRDDGAGLPPEPRDGLGLRNTRLRLEQLFPRDHRMVLSAGDPNGTVVTVDLPFRAVADATTSHDVVDDTATFVDAADDAKQQRRIGVWLPVFAAWSLMAMVWTELRAINERFSDWSTLFASGALNAGLWMALTPVVIRYARWVGRRGARAFRVAAHALGAALVGPLHTGLWMLALHVVHSKDFTPVLRSMFGWMIWDSAAYVLIVCLVTLTSLAMRIRDSRMLMAAHRARLGEARVAALRLRLQPRVLLGALDALERVVAIDAARSEAAITRMGDLLRLLLARAEQEWVDVAEEVELLTAFLDVVNAWHLPASSARRPAISFDGADRRLPAMLLPTLATAAGGALHSVEIRGTDDHTVIRLTATRDVFDRQAFDEISDRLARLYGGRERLTSRRDADGARVIEAELPATPSVGDIHLRAIDRAIA